MHTHDSRSRPFDRTPFLAFATALLYVATPVPRGAPGPTQVGAVGLPPAEGPNQ
jgi:hypothetical protein